MASEYINGQTILGNMSIPSSYWLRLITRNFGFSEKLNIFGIQMEFLLLVFVLMLLVLEICHRQIRAQSGLSSIKNLLVVKSTFPPQVNWFSKIISLPIILNGWYTMIQLGSVGIRVFEDCARLYGKTFMLPLGPLNTIATSDIRIIQKLLSSNDPGHLNKSGYVYKKLFVEELHDGIFVSLSNVWLPHRKALSPGFTYSAINSYLPIINKFAKDLTQDILAFNKEQGIPLHDGDVFAKFLSTRVLKFLGDWTTGPGSYTDEQIAQIQEGSKTNKDCVLFLGERPLLFLRPLWKLHPISRVSAQATQKLEKALGEMVENYKSTSKDSSVESPKYTPLVELMLSQNWTEKEIFANLASLVFAENDAAFNGIHFSLLQLALNPDHQAICHEEIDALFSSKSETTSGSSADEIDIADLSELKYLERCILETLRIFPPIPAFGRRLKTKLKIDDDLEISAKKTVLVMPCVLHKDPILYPDPNKFDPDRFLPENTRKRPIYAYLPFSAGRRNCLGWKLSLFQIKVALAWLLRRFEISTEERVEDMKFFFALRSVPGKNFDLVFKERKNIE